MREKIPRLNLSYPRRMWIKKGLSTLKFFILWITFPTNTHTNAFLSLFRPFYPQFSSKLWITYPQSYKKECGKVSVWGELSQFFGDKSDFFDRNPPVSPFEATICFGKKGVIHNHPHMNICIGHVPRAKKIRGKSPPDGTLYFQGNLAKIHTLR